MPKHQCLIDIKLANALNQFLYKAGFHRAVYKELGFTCPGCKKPVSPNIKGKRPRSRFVHVDEDVKDPCGYYKKKKKAR